MPKCGYCEAEVEKGAKKCPSCKTEFKVFKKKLQVWFKILLSAMIGILSVLSSSVIIVLTNRAAYNDGQTLIFPLLFLPFLGGLIGFLFGLLMFKVKNVMAVGLIIGFIFPIVLSILGFVSTYILGSNAGWTIVLIVVALPAMIVGLFLGPLHGDGGLAIVAFILLFSPIFYSIIGALIGILIYRIRKIKPKKS